MFMPVGGTVVEVNSKIESSPEVVNKDPYGDGWLIKIKLSDASELDELLDAASYEKLLNA